MIIFPNLFVINGNFVGVYFCHKWQFVLVYIFEMANFETKVAIISNVHNYVATNGNFGRAKNGNFGGLYFYHQSCQNWFLP